MKIYYESRLSKQIEAGENGIDNLDYKNLAEDLIENEYYSQKTVNSILSADKEIEHKRNANTLKLYDTVDEMFKDLEKKINK